MKIKEDGSLDKYAKCIASWNNIFLKEFLDFPQDRETRNKNFDKGLEWLTDNTTTILDFGCGSGTVLFLCSHYGTKNHIGIDLSQQAIQNARKRSEKSIDGKFYFECGGVELLKEIDSASIDAIVLSNIIDNLYPEDVINLLVESKRILRTNGKILVKLNPYLSDEQIKEWNIKIIDNNLLDDGMILWNNSTKEWDDFLGSRFIIDDYKEIYYEEHEQFNRMYLLINN